MTTNQFNPSLLEESIGALTIWSNMIASPISRAWYATWGTAESERKQRLPGDNLVPNPRLVTNRAITIRATPGQVWPWLLQLGQGRGGLYSFQRLENLARCRIENLDEIRPELQDLAVGDRVRLGPDGYPFYTVHDIRPGVALVLITGLGDDSDTVGSWVFHLTRLNTTMTRLFVRSRLTYPHKFVDSLIWRVLTDPMYFVMERRMLIGIRDRAEHLATTYQPQLAI